MKQRIVASGLAVVIALLAACGDEPDDGNGPAPPELDSILAITPADTTLRVNESVQLSATLMDPDSQPISSFEIAYTALDPAIATTTGDGMVTGLNSGQTLVIGSVGGAADTVGVTVPMSFSNVDAGFSTCGVRVSGEGRCWGLNHQGELGAGPGAGGQGPVTPLGELVFSVVRSSASFDSTFSCGLTFVGEAHCWGNNTRGQLGTGDLVSSPAPRRVLGDQVFMDLDLGHAHACAITGQQEVFCWGANDSGQLGTGDSAGSSQPLRVVADLPFTTIKLGGSHSCALDDSGLAYCWGDGQLGQLGTGDTEGSPLPTPVLGDHHFISIDAGAIHTCGIVTNGDGFCWGRNISGEVGNGLFFFHEPVPSPSLVVGGHSWTAISAGVSHTCGITVEGPTYCWGSDADGRLGNGTSVAVQHPSPELVTGNHDFIVITTGYDYTCAISSAAGRPAYCWGRNNRGQLDGHAQSLGTASLAPRLVSGF